MADVFLSYSREDSARAAQVAQGLQAAGLEVFWDTEIPPGQTWADYIEQKLTQCKALIVLWSEHSTKSQWVREEARMGRDKGVLVPVMIDSSQPPFGFGEVQAANLANWNGEADNPNWRRFVDAVSNIAKQPARPVTQAMPAAPPRAAASSVTPPSGPASEKKSGVPVWVWVVGAVVATIVVLGIIGSMMPDTTQQQAANNPAGVQPLAGQQAGGQPAAPPAAGGQSAAVYQQQVMARLQQVNQSFVGQGFQQIEQPVSGALAQGQNATTPASLYAGVEYRIVGVCDNDCGDLDLVLYDQNNNVISQDQLTDATPIVSVAPQWTGPFTVQVVMHNCAQAPCYYALALYGRQMQ